MKLRVSNSLLPGVTAERTVPLGSELRREEIERDGTYIGTIVYVARKTKNGTEYGWRPEKAHPRSRLTTMVEAVQAVEHRWAERAGKLTDPCGPSCPDSIYVHIEDGQERNGCE